MLLKVAIIDSRESYLRKLIDAFAAEYSDRLEVVAFTGMEGFDEFTQTGSVDVMLVGSDLADEGLIGKRGATLVYLVDDKSIESVHGHRAICRFQKTNLLYKAILDACSDRFDHVKSKRNVAGDADILAFFPASGGAGASSMAAACAVAAARRGLRAFYLNLELLGTSQTYFQAMGAGGLDDILVAVEAKKENIAVRLQSAVKRSQHGVFFLDSCSNPLDIADLSTEHMERLVREVALSDSYDIIVLDMDYPHSQLAACAMDLATRTVFVSNGTPVSNAKFERLYQMLQAQGRGGLSKSVAKVVLAYNNFSSKSGRRLASDVVPVARGLPRVVDQAGEPVGGAQLAEALSAHKVFDWLLSDTVAQKTKRQMQSQVQGQQAMGGAGLMPGVQNVSTQDYLPQQAVQGGVQAPFAIPGAAGAQAPFAIPGAQR